MFGISRNPRCLGNTFINGGTCRFSVDFRAFDGRVQTSLASILTSPRSHYAADVRRRVHALDKLHKQESAQVDTQRTSLSCF